MDNKRARLDDPKGKKRILDKESRQENRDVIVGLTKIAPTLKQLVEPDAIERFKELVELLHEGQNLTHSIQDIKALILELREVVPSVMQITQLLKALIEVAPVISQMVPLLLQFNTMAQNNGQNFVNQGMMAEQQNNENDGAENFFDTVLLDECGNGSNMEELTNAAPSSYPSMGYMGILTLSESSNHNNDETFDDEQVNFFFQKFDVNFKRDVKYSDFNGLEEELNKVGRNVLPTYLTPLEEKIRAIHGDITTDSKLSKYAAFPIYLMFHVTVKEMDELNSSMNLELVTFTKLELWRDVILDGEQINLNVQFAKDYLMEIARAYFGSKAKLYEEKKGSELAIWRKKLQFQEECREAIISFRDKSSNTGLFPNS